jgi:hypothetical protein
VQRELEIRVEQGPRKCKSRQTSADCAPKRTQQANQQRGGGHWNIEPTQCQREGELEHVPLRKLAPLAAPRRLGEVGLDHALFAEMDQHVRRYAEAELYLLERERLLRHHNRHCLSFETGRQLAANRTDGRLRGSWRALLNSGPM